MGCLPPHHSPLRRSASNDPALRPCVASPPRGGMTTHDSRPAGTQSVLQPRSERSFARCGRRMWFRRSTHPFIVLDPDEVEGEVLKVIRLLDAGSVRLDVGATGHSRGFPCVCPCLVPTAARLCSPGEFRGIDEELRQGSPRGTLPGRSDRSERNRQTVSWSTFRATVSVPKHYGPVANPDPDRVDWRIGVHLLRAEPWVRRVVAKQPVCLSQLAAAPGWAGFRPRLRRDGQDDMRPHRRCGIQLLRQAGPCVRPAPFGRGPPASQTNGTWRTRPLSQPAATKPARPAAACGRTPPAGQHPSVGWARRGARARLERQSPLRPPSGRGEGSPRSRDRLIFGPGIEHGPPGISRPRPAARIQLDLTGRGGPMSVSRRYTAVLTREPGWWVGHCLRARRASKGNTIEEAQDNLKEAVELYLGLQPRR